LANEAIPLSSLEASLEATLNECADSGRPVVVELPDHRLIAIQSLDPADDDLIDRLFESNDAFRSLVKKSAMSPRKPFVLGS
jgi:hypothetical protein